MMKHYRWMFFLVLLLLPFCSNRGREHVAVSSAEVSSAVEADVLRAAVLRKLSALEADTQVASKRPASLRKAAPEAESSREPMYMRYRPPR